jgi:putative FmdB family regulatory protein
VTYEYICDGCGHEWEEDQGIKDEPVRKCPECGEDKARRLIGRTYFVLKGTGWAADGY